MNQPFESQDQFDNVSRFLKILTFASALNCFSKAEINFPLFLFSLIVIGKKQDQIVRVFYLLIVTSFTDFVWIFLWYKKYQLPEYQEMSNQNQILFYYSLTLSCILLVLKIFVFVYIAYCSQMVRFYLSFDGIMKAISDIFNGIDEEEEKALQHRIK